MGVSCVLRVSSQTSLKMSELKSLLFLSLVIFVTGREPVTTIEPSYGPDWGEWNGGVMCPDNTFAHGFEQKTDAWCSGGGECTGLNGIQMMCGRLTEDTYETVVREYEGPFGDWHEERLCKAREFLKQGQQNYQEYQGMFVDDSGSMESASSATMALTSSLVLTLTGGR